MSRTRVLLVDDQRLFVDGCQAVLETEPDMEVVGIAANAQEALDMTQHTRPDVVVMDIEMPPGMNGITATRCLRMRDPDSRVVLLSAWNQRNYILDGIKAGAVGYVIKDTARTDLVQAIRGAAKGERVVHPSVLPNLFEILAEMPELHDQVAGSEPNKIVLKERERHLLHLLASGLSNAELCDGLGWPEGTLKSIMQKLFAKLGAHSRQQAVEQARRRGLL